MLFNTVRWVHVQFFSCTILRKTVWKIKYLGKPEIIKCYFKQLQKHSLKPVCKYSVSGQELIVNSHEQMPLCPNPMKLYSSVKKEEQSLFANSEQKVYSFAEKICFVNKWHFLIGLRPPLPPPV